MFIVQRVLDDPVALATWALAGATLLLALGTILMVGVQTKALMSALRTDALSRLTAAWDSKEMRARRRQLARWLLTVDRTSAAVSDNSKIAEVPDFFEEVGALLRKKRLDFDLVWQTFSEDAVGWWEAIGQIYAEKYRRDFNDSASYSEYEYLVCRIKKEDKRRVPQNAGWKDKDVRSFLEAERDLMMDEPVRIVSIKSQDECSETT